MNHSADLRCSISNGVSAIDRLRNQSMNAELRQSYAPSVPQEKCQKKVFRVCQ